MGDWEEGITLSPFKLWDTEGDMVALIDGDMLPYIVGYTAAKDNLTLAEAVALVDDMVNVWTRGAKADAAKIYLTASPEQYRFTTAFQHAYKGQRKQEKPPHFRELREHLIKKHNAIVAIGNEADDLMSIEQYTEMADLIEEDEALPKHFKQFACTVIVTKDKDLRIRGGLHKDPGDKVCRWVDTMGSLDLIYKKNGTIKKLEGTGLMFFYSQLITGDTVDNYKGLPGKGPAFAHDLLAHLTTEEELYDAVSTAYTSKYGPDRFELMGHTGVSVLVGWLDLLVEQGRLAHMQRWEDDMFMPDHVLPWEK